MKGNGVNPHLNSNVEISHLTSNNQSMKQELNDKQVSILNKLDCGQ